MAKDVSVKMELPLEDGEELLPEVEKIADADNKESNKQLNDAEKVVDDINKPKDVDTPKQVEIKILKEQLILPESEPTSSSDLQSDVYDALSEVAYSFEVEKDLPLRKDDFKRAVDFFIDHFFGADEDDDDEILGEDLKLIKPLNDYKPWSGAVDTWEKIVDAGLVDQLDSILEEIYPDGLTEGELNDLLWFEPEWILDALGLDSEEVDED